MKIRVVADMLEERWPSMDLFAEMLVQYLPQSTSGIEVELFRPPMKRRGGRFRDTRVTISDRIIGRHVDYPRQLRRCRPVDIHHIVDQSYAAAANALPRGRTVVTCHDLDTFGPLTRRSGSIAGLALRQLTKITLRGLRKAERVVCVSETVKRDLLEHNWIAADRITVIPGGAHPSCSPSADLIADTAIQELLGPSSGPEILHVGSTIRRKRIETLLEAFAGVQKHRPDARLLRVGGPFTPTQQSLVTSLGLSESIVVLPFLDRPALAALYRRATLVVMPSEREGFGLPIVEAMACGTPVLASDLEVFREVGGNAIAYVSVADHRNWTEAILSLLHERDLSPTAWNQRIDGGLRRSALFSWPEHARQLRMIYDDVLNHP